MLQADYCRLFVLRAGRPFRIERGSAESSLSTHTQTRKASCLKTMLKLCEACPYRRATKVGREPLTSLGPAFAPVGPDRQSLLKGRQSRLHCCAVPLHSPCLRRPLAAGSSPRAGRSRCSQAGSLLGRPWLLRGAPLKGPMGLTGVT